MFSCLYVQVRAFIESGLSIEHSQCPIASLFSNKVKLTLITPLIESSPKVIREFSERQKSRERNKIPPWPGDSRIFRKFLNFTKKLKVLPAGSGGWGCLYRCARLLPGDK